MNSEPNDIQAPCGACNSVVLPGKGFNHGFDVVCLDCHKRNAEPGVLDGVHAIEQMLRRRGKQLRPYQAADARWLASRDRALLAQHAGAGKSAATLSAIKGIPPVIVLCPKVAKGVWEREVGKWRPDYKFFQAEGKKSFVRPPSRGEIVAINYEILPTPKKIQPDEDTILVIDECHRMKSPDAKVTKRARAWARLVLSLGGKVWGLTGTPLLNRPDELWELLFGLQLAEEAFGDKENFKRLYHARKGKFGGWEYGRPDPEVPELLKRVMLRRRREDILGDLPPLTVEDVPIHLDPKTQKVCDEAMEALAAAGMTLEDLVNAADKADEAIEIAPSGKRKLVFEKIAAARAALAQAKLPYLIELIQDLEEAEEPVLAFSAHLAAAEVLGKRPGWATITGGGGDRKKVEDDFQEGKLKGIAGTIQAAGVALTLTRAAHVVMLDLCWTPALNEQAAARCIAAGEMVHARSGFKPIEDIVVGDEVLTHDGRWKRVYATSSRMHEGEMCEIRYRRYNRPLVCTPDHKLLVLRKDGSAPAWVEASHIRPDDFLCMPRPKQSKDMEYVLSSERPYYPRTFRNQYGASVRNHMTVLPDAIEIDDDMLWTFGWHAAEGSCQKGAVSLSGHEREIAILQRIADRFKKLGLGTYIYRKTGTKGIALNIHSVELSAWFKDWFGHKAINKHFPPVIMDLPPKKARVVYDAYVLGDGNMARGSKNARQYWDSVSPTLAAQTALLALKCGLNASLAFRPNRNKENPHWKDQWQGCLTENGTPTDPRMKKFDADFVYNPVKSTSVTNTSTMVYDLSVEEDHSFVVGMASVHNCHRIGQQRPVIVQRLISSHPLDKRVTQLLDAKQKLIDASIEGACRDGDWQPPEPPPPEGKQP